eukprot:Seg6490.2 transcript_id=Seg6490.2/GoldUCD/mRNA.D3Y31 product="hypothetical protein" protein_id=Seg6490.2/GoldUCD/D3Y31
MHADICAEKATATKSYAHLVEDLTDDIFFEEMEQTNEMQQHSTDQMQVDSDTDMSVKEYRKAIKEEVAVFATKYNVDSNDNMCHMNIRRLHAWKDYVSFFQKPWNKKKAAWPIIVTFLGEAAVDTGGPRR